MSEQTETDKRLEVLEKALAAVRMSYEDERRVQDEAAANIDSSWHYSWHWDRTDVGSLTYKGWQQALDDGMKLFEELSARIERVRSTVVRVRNVVGRNTLQHEYDELVNSLPEPQPAESQP